MRSRISIIVIVSTMLLSLFACDADTATIGADIMPKQDSLMTNSEAFPIYTKSVKTPSVIANTSNCYIGSVIDPETDIVTTSSFIAQFHIQEEYTLPDEASMIKDEQGKIVADSCFIRIFHDKYYGDSLATMKLTVTDLRQDTVMSERDTYYTDFEASYFKNPQPKVSKTISYSVIDQNLPNAVTSLSSGNYRSIPINIGAEYGSYILQNYYEHHEYFKNSYTFIHNVCPGFYFEHTGGIGALINSDVTALDIYFRYNDKNGKEVKAWMRMGATQEVLQNSTFRNDIPNSLLNQEYTLVKSPAAVHTEIVLPIDEIANGEHYNDTLNSARFTMRRYMFDEQTPNNLTPPSHLLLIRKGQANEFFAKHKMPDNKTSYLCAFNSKTNAFTFTNIAPLISNIRQERDKAAGVKSSDTMEERKEKWEKLSATSDYWKDKGDWQAFDLIPVEAIYTSSGNSYYGNTNTLTEIRNDFNMHSVKLEGSNNGEVKLNVIYSRFYQDKQ